MHWNHMIKLCCSSLTWVSSIQAKGLHGTWKSPRGLKNINLLLTILLLSLPHASALNGSSASDDGLFLFKFYIFWFILGGILFAIFGRFINPNNMTVEDELRELHAIHQIYFQGHLTEDELIEFGAIHQTNIRGRANGYTRSARKKGLDSKMIKTFPESVYSAVKNKEEVIHDGVCAVCLNNYEDKDMVRLLPCCHAFHTECIDRWLLSRTTCPNCRYNLLEATASESNDIAIDIWESSTEMTPVPETTNLNNVIYGESYSSRYSFGSRSMRFR